MKTGMKHGLLFGSIFSMALFGSGPAISAVLGAHEGNDGCGSSNLYRIDTVLQTVTVIAPESGRCGPELQLSPDGSVIYMSSQAGTLRLLSPVTGLTTTTLALSNFPSPTNIVTAMEFIGSTLYASLSQQGPETPGGVLATVNLSTGVLTPIGAMNPMNRPTGGMSYANGVLYAVTSTDNNDSGLYTVDPNTGAATLVAPITLASVQQDSASGLAFADGKMYLVKTNDTTLYSVNLTTGALTAEFDMQVYVNSLTGPLAASAPVTPAMVPTLSEWATLALMMLLGLVGLAKLRRRG